ncbi:hypothetical protein F7U66_24685 [Vibrio parahaemolyticus]|nr:hypothetical protein [Vibrio parahaemolyticus]
MFNTSECISFEEMDIFIRHTYKEDRLYGRNGTNGWDDDYGKRIVTNYLETINVNEQNPHIVISRHEAKSGYPGFFRRGDILKFVYNNVDENRLRKLIAETTIKMREIKHLVDMNQPEKSETRIFHCLNIRKNIIRNRLNLRP